MFGSTGLGRKEKCRALQLTVRRILALCQAADENGLTFYYRAAMLGKLYRFLVEQELLCGEVPFEPSRPLAFFPGTFDPFTLSHKGIVRAIRDEGFEVLLAIDEFSWSKRTQPYRIRREIAAMSNSWATGSIRWEMSRLASTASRMRVELISSSSSGSVSSSTWPLMHP